MTPPRHSGIPAFEARVNARKELALEARGGVHEVLEAIATVVRVTERVAGLEDAGLLAETKLPFHCRRFSSELRLRFQKARALPYT